ncbi:MAG: outer membrane lipoprotein-sorting protein [Panacagrimonas sp.]
MRALLWLMMSLLTLPGLSVAASDPASIAMMEAVGRHADIGRQQARLRFVLTPKSGAAQVRESVAYRGADDEVRKLAIVFESPAAIRGSGFLTWDARDPALADDQWLYLPALRRTRRIPGRERGSYFLGTDMSYDDIRSFGRIQVAEYRLSPQVKVPGQPHLTEISGEPVDAATAKDLGYSRVLWRIDTQRALIVQSTHWDLQGQVLKTVTYDDFLQLGMQWTPRSIVVNNLKTGHRTELYFSDIANDAIFDMAQLTPAGLERSR